MRAWSAVLLLTTLTRSNAFSQTRVQTPPSPPDAAPPDVCDGETLFAKHAVHVDDVDSCLNLLNGVRRVAARNNSADLAAYVASTWRWTDPVIRDVSTLVQPVVWLVQYPKDLELMRLNDFAVQTWTLAHPLFPPGPDNRSIDEQPPFKPGSLPSLWSRAKEVATEEVEGHTWLTWTYVHAPSRVDPSRVAVYRYEFLNMLLEGQAGTEGHMLCAVCGMEDLGEVDATSQVLSEDQFAFEQ